VVRKTASPSREWAAPRTSQQFVRQVGAALRVSAFVLAATVDRFRLGLLLLMMR
jgi:hypothetical protein